MSALTDLQAAVAAETTVNNSVEALVLQLAQQVKDAGTDPVALEAVVATMQSNAASLGAFVTANTPAASGSTAAPAGSTPPKPAS